MSEDKQLPVPVNSGEIINAVANQLSILNKIIPGVKKIVLVVEDDEPVNRWICKMIHERFAGRVKTIQFFNGKPAYEYLLKNLPNVHLIISGIRMPEMDGVQFLRLCKELNPQLPFIIHTGYDLKTIYKANPATSAADACILKPNLTELLNTVEKFLFASNPLEGMPFVITDTIPIPLGIEGQDGLMIPVFRKGTAVPCETLLALELDRGSDGEFSLNLFQGFSTHVNENVAFCFMHVQNDLAPAHQWAVYVKLAVDENGFLKVEVIDRQTKQSCKVLITYQSGGLSLKDIADLERNLKE